MRSEAWLAATGCQRGATIWFVLPEMGVDGWALVKSVGPCPPIEPGPGRVVLSTVTHLNSFVLRIWLDGLDEPIEPTEMHRLYSEDAGDWVPAGQLTVGDRLRTLHGPATIARIDARPGTHRVYNLEVETEHCYFVSAAGVLSHNETGCGFGILRWSREVAEHVRLHNRNNLKKAIHGVFYDDGVLVAEEAWARAKQLGMMPGADGVVNVPMGRCVGWEGGYAGSGQGLTYVRIVVNAVNDVITAYPVVGP